MSSIILKIRKSDAEFTEKAANCIKVDDTGNDWFHMPMWFKKVGDGLFAEYSYEDLPEQVKEMIDKTEKIY